MHITLGTVLGSVPSSLPSFHGDPNRSWAVVTAVTSAVGGVSGGCSAKRGFPEVTPWGELSQGLVKGSCCWADIWQL